MPRFDISPSRHGFTLTEVIVSMVLLGTVISIVVPLTKRAIDQRRQVEARRAALLEVSNTLERLVAVPSARPKSGDELVVPVPAPLVLQFDDPKLVVTNVSIDAPVPGHRLDASLTWNSATGRQASPIQLSAFVFDDLTTGRTP